MHLKRQPRKTRWTAEYAKTKAANIAIRQHEKQKKTDDVPVVEKTKK